MLLGPPAAHRGTARASVVAWSVPVHSISLPPRLVVFAFRSLHTWGVLPFLVPGFSGCLGGRW